MNGAYAAKNSAVRAMSAGVPMRLRMVRSMIFARVPVSLCHSGHNTGPGAMPFTRISGPSSLASERVSMCRPALAAQYTV